MLGEKELESEYEAVEETLTEVVRLGDTDKLPVNERVLDDDKVSEQLTDSEMVGELDTVNDLV